MALGDGEGEGGGLSFFFELVVEGLGVSDEVEGVGVEGVGAPSGK